MVFHHNTQIVLGIAMYSYWKVSGRMFRNQWRIYQDPLESPHLPSTRSLSRGTGQQRMPHDTDRTDPDHSLTTSTLVSCFILLLLMFHSIAVIAFLCFLRLQDFAFCLKDKFTNKDETGMSWIAEERLGGCKTLCCKY